MGHVQETARRNGFAGVSFVGCSWGEELGVPIDRFDSTLPPEVVTRDMTGAAPLTDAELATATWEIDLQHPARLPRSAVQQLALWAVTSAPQLSAGTRNLP